MERNYHIILRKMMQLTVLKRDTLKSSVLMGAISIVLAFLLDMVIPFHFG